MGREESSVLLRLTRYVMEPFRKADSTCPLGAFEDLSMEAGAFVYGVRISLDRFAALKIAGHIDCLHNWALITAEHLVFAPTFSEHDYKYVGLHPICFPEGYCLDCKLHRRPLSLFRGLHYYEFYSRIILLGGWGLYGRAMGTKCRGACHGDIPRDYLGVCESGLESRCICSHPLISTGEKCTIHGTLHIPFSCQATYMAFLHQGHQGTSKTKYPLANYPDIPQFHHQPPHATSNNLSSNSSYEGGQYKN
ncbi:hypothetical protein EV426DRAFT_615930 [Tirmania nivea]|nr:hypothetical protein EV426DRAFT_615930 [Tirmania nivea]